MYSSRCFALLLALSLPAMHVVQAESSSSSSNPATQTQDQAQQSDAATQDQGQLSVQARIRARRAQRRAAAIRDAYGHLYDASAGFGYMRFRLPSPLQRVNEYAWDAGLTRYFNERLGVTLDARGNYGTAFIEPQEGNPPAGSIGLTKPAISQYQVFIGPSYRFYTQPKFSISGRVMGGVSLGDFTGAMNGYGTLGVLYPNSTTFAANAAIIGEYNISPTLGIRLAPDYTLTGFGSSTQNSLGYTLGIVYRFGKQ
jgi:hypothetical protein